MASASLQSVTHTVRVVESIARGLKVDDASSRVRNAFEIGARWVTHPNVYPKRSSGAFRVVPGFVRTKRTGICDEVYRLTRFVGIPWDDDFVFTALGVS